MKLVVRMSLTGLLALVPAVAVTAPALACGNSYRYEIDPKTNMIVRAEEALHEGQFTQAAKLAQDATGAIGKSVEGQDDPPALASLRARALRVASIAAVKSEGKVDLKSGDQKATMAWAVKQLRVLVQREPGNPYLQARLADGLATTGDAGEKEALGLLEKLAADDLMPDAGAWQLLASLQAKAGNAGERDKALEQCKKRATNPATCVVKTPGQA